MDIIVRMRGATAEECRRGARAARQVFDRMGVSPQDGARGMSMLEAWDIGGFHKGAELTAEQSHAADAWQDAQIAASNACCLDWPAERPRTAASLELLTNPEFQLVDRDTALRKLREIISSEDRSIGYFNHPVAILAERMADGLEDAFLAHELQGDSRLFDAGHRPVPSGRTSRAEAASGSGRDRCP